MGLRSHTGWDTRHQRPARRPWKWREGVGKGNKDRKSGETLRLPPRDRRKVASRQGS